MASPSKDQNDGIVEINMTPMVDIMLVLLVIFMVASSLISHKEISVSLPQAATASKTTPTELNFTIDNSSKLFLDAKEVNYDHLGLVLKQAKSSGKPVLASISADKTAPYGAVITLIDFVRANGITDFSIVTAGR